MTRSTWIGSLGIVVVLSCGESGDSNKPDDMMLSGSGGQPAMLGTGSGGAASTPVMNGGSAGCMARNMIGSGGSPAATSTGGSGAVADAGAWSTIVRRAPIPKNCQGFPLEGLKYSPGGDVLPNKCMPFNPTTNNPYAVRCIDAIPELQDPASRAISSASCRRRPKGHPGRPAPAGQRETYWRRSGPATTAATTNPPDEWVLEPGDEITQNYRGHATNYRGEELLPHVLPHAHRFAPQHHHHARVGPSRTAGSEGVGDALPGLFDSARARSSACSAASSARTTARR